MAYELYRNWRYVASYSSLNYLQAGASFLLTMLVADFLTVSEFSDYRFGLVILSIVSVAGLYGADRGLLVDLIHKKDEKLTVVSYFFIRVVVSLSAAFLVILYVYLTEAASKVLIAVMFSVAAVFMALRSPGWFDFMERLRQHAAILFVERLLLVLGAVAAIGWWYLDAVTLGLMTVASVLITLLVELIIMLRRVDLSELKIKRLLHETMDILNRYSWVWLLTLSNMLMTSFGQMVLYSRGGQNELAYLGLALQFSAVARLFMQQVVRLHGASIAVKTDETQDRKELMGHMARTIGIVVLGGIALFVIIGCIATIILSVFFDKKYMAAIPTVWTLGLWVIVLGVGLNVNRYIIGLGLQKAVFFASALWGSVSIILTYLLAPEYGALGFAFVLLGCHAASVLSQFFILFLVHR